MSRKLLSCVLSIYLGVSSINAFSQESSDKERQSAAGGVLLDMKNWTWVPTVNPPTLPVPPAGKLSAGWTRDCHPEKGGLKEARIFCETTANGGTYLTVDRAGTSATDGLVYTFREQLSGDFCIELDALNNDMEANYIDLRDASGNTVITVSSGTYASARYIGVGGNKWYFSGDPAKYEPFLEQPYLSSIVPTYTWFHIKFKRGGNIYTLTVNGLSSPGEPNDKTASWNINAGSAPAAASIRFNNAAGYQWSAWANVKVNKL